MQILSPALTQAALPALCRQPSVKLARTLPSPRRQTRASAQISVQPLPIKPRHLHFDGEIRKPHSARDHIASLNKLLEPEPRPADERLPEVPKASDCQNGDQTGGLGFFQGLDLGGIWPGFGGSSEDMSPRDLNDIHRRLLANSPQHSPREHLGERWLDYHGRDDWAGLLDPLDDNLRREVVRYGEFVQAAYRSFGSDTVGEASSRLPEVELPDKSYKVTKALYATSSIGLPEWVDEVAPDLGWRTQRTSMIGYVAVCDDEREIRRMGRRDIVIALRGTCTCLEWAENVRAGQVPLGEPTAETDPQDETKVECGFWSLYTTPAEGTHNQSLSQMVVEEIQRLVRLYDGEALSISVTGHSLGAALALLAADELSSCCPGRSPPVAVFSFGGPRVGNSAFARRMEEKGVKVLRVVNEQDVVTMLPAGVPVAGGEVLPWSYTHVGSELRVECRSSPLLKPNADMACCHDLEAYLHLVDGFKGRDQPFRANAKRCLAKLLNEQQSNVKSMYTKKKALRLNLESLSGNFGGMGGAGSSSPWSAVFPAGCLPSPS